jgi:hypothetical protein
MIEYRLSKPCGAPVFHHSHAYEVVSGGVASVVVCPGWKAGEPNG